MHLQPDRNDGHRSIRPAKQSCHTPKNAVFIPSIFGRGLRRCKAANGRVENKRVCWTESCLHEKL